MSNLVRVRSTRVGGRDYLQVVRYVNESGKSRLHVIKSFGRDNLENRLKANQFASNYNSLYDQAQTELQNQAVNVETLLKGALVVFGIFLGAKIISEILDELFE